MSTPLDVVRARAQQILKGPLIDMLRTRIQRTIPRAAPLVAGHTTPGTVRGILTTPQTVIAPIMGTIYASIFNPTSYPPLPPIKGTIYT